MPSPFIFNSVSRTHFGPGAALQIAQLCESLGILKPLIVTDQGIIKCQLLNPVLDAFNDCSSEPTVYSDVLADPPEQSIFDALAVAQEAACDGVIGFGGGSSMDVAKLLAILLNTDQPLSAMYGVEMVSGQRLPLIQVPTTAGTGSEATAVAIVTTGESTKAGVVSSILFADHIVLDPELTLGLPAHVTAATGIDAMVHAIEAFTSARLKNPLSDMVALKALQLLSKNIVTAVQTGSDLEARSDMLLGAMLAGQAFANAPVGAVHALAYPLGGTYHIPHGLSNSLVLPHVLRFNAPAANDLYFEISQVMHGLDSSSISSANAGQELANYFADLASSLGLQTQLRQMNIKPEALEDLASQSMNQQRLLINNPRVVELADALAIYQQAY
ncbi:MAG: alcohol dehydrogenase class IV [Polaribacter sp.]|jgi:alcohol dehydrogenase class IV